MGRGGGSAETRRPDRGKKRAVSGDLGEEDQRELISLRLPDDGRGHKRSPDGDGDDSDLRENISRRLRDDSRQQAPSGAPQQYGLDPAGTATRSTGPVKMSVNWNSKVEELESQAAWDGSCARQARVQA